MQNLDIVDINDEQTYSAKVLAGALNDPQTRKRGMIEMLGISCAINYLYAKRIKIDTSRSVYKIPLLFEEFKISDIYFGNYRIDVITLYKEKNIKIPKIHYEMDIMPHFYFIVQIGSKIQEAKMIGFIDAKDVLKCSSDSKFFYPTLDLIFSLQRFRTLTKRSVASKTLLGKHIDCMGLFLKFIDNDLSSVYKKQLIQHLMNCDACRARFIDVMEFERIASSIRFYPELAKKYDKVPTKNIETINSEKNKFTTLEEELNKVVNKIKTTVDKVSNEVENTISEDDSGDESEISKDTQSQKTSQTNLVIPKKAQKVYDYIVDKKESSKKVIDTIFSEKMPKIELPSIKTISKVKSKRKLITICALSVIIGSFLLISFIGTNRAIEENKQIANLDQVEQYNQNQDIENYDNFDEGDLLPASEQDIDDFTIQRPSLPKSPGYSPTISKLSWEAPENLVQKESYTKFLQLIGKNIKLNLQNDLLLVSDIPTNKTVKVDINIASNGNVNSVKMVKSSGSEAIDNSVKKIVNETLTFMKPPSHGLIGKTTVTLSLELN